MDFAKLRAFWWRRQGLDGSLRGRTAAEVLSQAGWARSVGGASPYLGLWARAGLSREAVDAEVAAVQIHELPSARNCTFVLPAVDYAVGLSLSHYAGSTDLAVVQKLGTTEAELARLCDGVLQALTAGDMDPKELKEQLGDLVRSYGEEGKKRGVATSLPVALGILQREGRIRRVPVNGRLDQERYRYALWREGPLPQGKPMDKEEALLELARRFWSWHGIAQAQQFQTFSLAGVKTTQALVAELELRPVEPESPWLGTADTIDEFRSHEAAPEPQYAVLGSLDSLFNHRRDVSSLIEPADHSQYMAGEKGKPILVGHLMELENHGIIDRGRLIGFWEFDPAAGKIVWTSFIEPDAALRSAVAQAETFAREQLGDVRSFSLDSPKSREPKLDSLRAMAKT